MRPQRDALTATDWDVLVILDACRADSFQALVPEAESVESESIGTIQWIRDHHDIFVQRNAIYFTAMIPVKGWNLRHAHPLEVVPVCDWCWGKHTAAALPALHPEAMNGAVLTYLKTHRLHKRPVIVHYGQPHVPLIGAPHIAAFPNKAYTGLKLGAASMCWVWKQAVEGVIEWAELRAAYEANVALVWRSVQNLLRHMKGTAVITADHGTVFDEHGPRARGHGHSARYPEQQIVPWHVMQCGQNPVTKAEQLEALGYL